MLPFEVDRNSQVSLTEQIEAGFRQAIQTSRYKDGESLPTLRETAKSLNVSLGVVLTAIKRLSREGLVTARPSRGIQVCSSGQHRWQAHVLYLHWGGAASFYEAVFSDTVMNLLLDRQILVTPILLRGSEWGGSPRLYSVIHAGPIDLAVLAGAAAGIGVVLAENEIPFVHLTTATTSDQPSRLARRALVRNHSPALKPAVRHAVECGIRSIVIVGDCPYGGAAAFAEVSGLTVQTLDAPRAANCGSPESTSRGGMAAMERFLDSRAVLPDLIYFPDDVLAQGGLMALLARGIRIPEDIQVISWANRNSGPVFPKLLTRIEVDPLRDGQALTDLVMEALAKPDRKVKEPVVIGPEFIVGETTRRMVDG